MDKESRMQRHLPLLRSCVGWTAKELASKLGVSRQTMCALEKDGGKLSTIQYLAIRKLLDDVIVEDKKSSEKEETHMLESLLEILVDNPERYTSDDVNEALSKAKLMAPAIMKQPTERKVLSMAWPMLIVAGGAAGGIILSAAMLALLKNKRE